MNKASTLRRLALRAPTQSTVVGADDIIMLLDRLKLAEKLLTNAANVMHEAKLFNTEKEIRAFLEASKK
jgi:hypothetical protein